MATFYIRNESSFYFSTRANEIGRTSFGVSDDKVKLDGAENIHVFTQAGNCIYAGDTDGRVWRMNGLKRGLVYTGRTAVTALGASADGSIVYVGFADGLIYRLEK